LLKKGIDDLLLLAHKFLALFEPVGFALAVNDGTVGQDAVENGGGDGDVGKNLVPLGEGFVGGKDGRGFLIASGDQLEEQVSALESIGRQPISSRISILYLAKTLSLSGRRSSK